MSDSKIVTLSGQMGSGKDTLATILREIVPGAESYAFADHLKTIAMEVFGLSWNEVYGDDKEKEFQRPFVLSPASIEQVHAWIVNRNPSYGEECLHKALEFGRGQHVITTSRKLQQILGTEIMRECYHPDYHILQVQKRIEDAKPTLAIVTDCRFPNELFWGNTQGATTVYISGRTREDFKKDNFNKHASETSMGSPEDYDIHIDNSGTMFQLKENAVSLAKKLELI
jgi:hypothetical protein